VCAVDEVCVAGVCTSDAFRILSLDTQCWMVDDTVNIDTPKGPIAFGIGMLYYSGAALVLGYDFVGNYSVSRSHTAIPTLTSDLATGDLWALGHGQGWATSAGSTITHLVPVVAGNLLEPGTPVPLSESFVIPGGAGLFAGFGHVGVHTGTELILMETATGDVTRLASPALDAAACVGPFYSGLLEQHSGGLRLTYVQAGTDAVVRTRPSDGATQVVLQGEDLGDMCGLAVNLSNSTWCFHLSQPSTQFDTQPGQSAAFCCEATFAVD
jgi:hypothetical protein